jgi:hypothetical protein
MQSVHGVLTDDSGATYTNWRSPIPVSPFDALGSKGEDARAASVEWLTVVSGSTARPDACTSWTSKVLTTRD